jgi:drug/metabolite transporter (DMT)-like permease
VNSSRREFWLGIASALGVVVLWTTFHLVSRAGIRSALTPYDLAALRFGVAALVLLPVAWRLRLGHLELWQAAVLALFAGPGFALFAFSGYLFAPVAHAGAILSGTVALFTALFGRMLLGDGIGKLQFAGLVVLAGGVGFLVGDGFAEGPPGQWIGDLMFLAGAASWAVYALLVRSWKVDALRGTFVTAIATALFFVPIHFVFLPSNFAAIDPLELAFQAGYHGAIGMIASTLLFTRAVVALGPALTTIIVAAVPATAALGGWLVFGEMLTGLTLGGIACVTTGMLGAVAGAQRSRRAAASRRAYSAGRCRTTMVESANLGGQDR